MFQHSHLQMRLGNIAHICEVHEICAAADDNPHLALLCLGHDGGHQQRVALPKNAAGPQRHSCKPLDTIRGQDPFFSQDLLPGGISQYMLCTS